MQRWPQKCIFGLRVADLASGMQILPWGCRSGLGDIVLASKADLALRMHGPGKPEVTIKNGLDPRLVWWHTTLLPGHIAAENKKFCWEKKILLIFEFFWPKEVVVVIC